MITFKKDIYQFNLDNFKEDIDKDNALLEYIVNRAIFLCKNNKYIIIENFNNNDIESKVMIYVLKIISSFLGMPIFIKKKIFKKKEYKNIHYISKRKFNKLKKDGFIFCPCTIETVDLEKYKYDNYDHINSFIFEGFSQDTILRIYNSIIKED